MKRSQKGPFRLSPSSVRMERIDLGSWADVEADHGVLQRLATAIRSQALKACQNRNDGEAREDVAGISLAYSQTKFTKQENKRDLDAWAMKSPNVINIESM